MITKNSIQGKYPIKHLEDVAEFLDNLRRPITAASRESGPYPYYGANGQQDSVANYIFDEPLVLIAEDGGLFDQPDRGIAYTIEGKTWVNNHAHVLRPKKCVDIRFLLRVLENYDVTPWITGSTRAKLTKGAASKIEIPVPPLAEQKRIAAILDKADAIRRKLQQSLRLSDDFLRSVFLDMFGDPEGQSWESTTVEELASAKKGSIRTGPFGSQLLHSEFVNGGVAVLGIDNAVRNKFAWGQPRFITEEKYEDLKRYTVHPGDVLITIMGTCGRCAIVPQDIPKAINTKHLCCITLDPKKCLPEFLHSYFLLHPMAKSYLGQSAKGAIMDGLNGGLIKSLPVPIVPITLQRKYAQLVKNRTKLVDRLTTQSAESEALFSSLQQRAFRGDI